LAAALAPGESRLFNVLSSQDITRTLSCLSALGAKIRREQDHIALTGLDLSAPDGAQATEPVDLDVGESGTTCRLITPIAALTGQACTIHGQGRMHDRPIGALTRVLEQLGVAFAWHGREGYPPLTLSSSGLNGGEVDISLEESSQYLSGLLLAGPLARSPLTIGVSGDKAVSWPYVALTLQVMQDFGVAPRVQTRIMDHWQDTPWTDITAVHPGRIRFLLQPGSYTPREAHVEGDWSNASYLIASGLFLHRGVRVRNLNCQSLQGDRKFLDILAAMGAHPICQGSSATLSPSPLTGADLDMGSCPDLVPTVAVLASLADGRSRIRNVAHLRLKESDRLQALATEISRTGCRVELQEDGLLIEPGPHPRGRRIDFTTYGDHRLAMSLSLYGLAGVGVRLDNPDCVQKSFPSFWKTWDTIVQAGREQRNSSD
jgi:3-phosphoshikimate 1-carboxyvinyltransferase